MAKIGARCGASAILPSDHPIGILSGNALKITVDDTRHSTSYIWQVLWSLYSEGNVEELRTVGAQPAISMANLKKHKIALPPQPEQRAIAAALSDVDALLDGLDRLIAKKRDLKQATMQQLLTGQTRLPDFHGEWEVKRLGEIGWTYGGLTAKTKADFGVGAGQYVTFMNVMTNVVVDCESFELVRVAPTELQNRVMHGDLLLNGSSETPDEVAMCSLLMEEVPDLYLNSFCFGFRLRDSAEVDGLFLAYYIRSHEGREMMKALAQGSTRYNLSKGALLDASIRLPSLPEQSAIAAVLSHMDAELAALEARRTKTHDIKQAMMQELLTGKTRLVPARAAAA
jgi:type I restriction enzyme S subunit